MWFCYILRCIDEDHKNLTYGGSTNNIKKRLQQHCGKISGGAKATRGKQWEVYALVTGFPDHNNCLSAEWRINHVTGKRGRRPAVYCGVNGRIKGLNEVLMLNRWTNKCKYDNINSNFKVYVTEDVFDNLKIDILPDNIEVFTVNKFSEKLLEKLSAEKIKK